MEIEIFEKPSLDVQIFPDFEKLRSLSRCLHIFSNAEDKPFSATCRGREKEPKLSVFKKKFYIIML